MKMISWNVRGLGGKVKKRAIRSLISSEKSDFLCMQETKKAEIDMKFCEILWGNTDFDWAFKPAEGRSGGILTIWSNSVFAKSATFTANGLLGVKGVWQDNTHCDVVNVYSPCSLNEKQELWGNIQQWMNADRNTCWCIVGDYNDVRNR